MNVRIHTRFTLRSPLSHIGETISTTTYLVEEPILQPDGSLEQVFCYSGNAWRGQLRDLAARYLLDALGSLTISLDAFHLLYSGGAIGGAQSTNLGQARAYRRLLPPIAIFGGGIGNQILPGKLRVSNFYPLCREAPSSAYPGAAVQQPSVSYRGLTFEKSFSRMDDAKDERLNAAIAPGSASHQALLPGAVVETTIKEKPQQMRMTSELLVAGTILTGKLDLLDCSEVELGCLVSALHAFSRSPHLGGQASRGHGEVELTTLLYDLDGGQTNEFVTVTDQCLLSPVAERAKDAYDRHLLQVYEAFLSTSGSEIRGLLGVAP